MVDKKIHKIRLQIQAFESKTLNDCCKEITMGMKQINSIIKGPIPMPTKKRIYCVLRSPHVNKDSREHFEIRVHKKFFDIFTTSNAPFLKLQMPTGAFFNIKRLN
jgi:small subunit ribosomal protein S10|uniref:ribosomal protein S10 n=1 Tax=Gonyostomum semen TaxID=375454 RepID=UPI00211430C5|nr:ribosomal protein S10 [Gonyostomum semen]UTE94472.1 ribosomal protein S10 [Gonyostomum semen]